MTHIIKRYKSVWIGLILVKLALFLAVGSHMAPSAADGRSDQSGAADRVRQWFGESFSTGKTPAEPGEQPWMVALVEADIENAYDGQFCGGSLIESDLVLTAAHCLVGFEEAHQIEAVIGRHVLSSSQGERIPAAEIYIHAGYDDYNDGEDNDIALIRLEWAATGGTPIQLINRQNAYVDDPGTVARATGWGILPEENDETPDQLHAVEIPVVSQETCQAIYGEDLLPDGLCAGLAEGGKDTCSGDSGGPLVARDDQGNPIQIGVVSWGDDCGAPESYGVYARLTMYEDWINSIQNGQIRPSDLSQYEEEGGWGEGLWGWFDNTEPGSWDADDEFYYEEDWDEGADEWSEDEWYDYDDDWDEE